MKFLLTFALCLTVAGVVLATNTQSVTQIGGFQSASVTQTGTGNVSGIYQYTDNDGPQISTVIQDGTNNLADVSQFQTGGGSNTPANTAYLDQQGTGNFGYQYQNAPGFNSGQHVIAYQIGIDNIVRQSINYGYTETAYSYQEGTENNAAQSVQGSHNDVDIIQFGMYNIATQTINGSNNGYLSARIVIDQQGENNIGYQSYTSSGFSHKNHGEIYQVGDVNYGHQFNNGRDYYSEIWQRGYFNWAGIQSTGDNNTANAHQRGDRNSVRYAGFTGIMQSGDWNSNVASQTGYGNSYNSEQWGFGNAASIAQVGDLNVSSEGNRWHTFTAPNPDVLVEMHIRGIYQNGNGNGARIASLGNRHQAAIDQRGNGNAGSIYQDDPTLNNWGANFSKIRQEGHGNSSSISATGRMNDAFNAQFGHNNSSMITQTGYGFFTEVYQSGNGNVSTVTQN